MCVIFTGNLDHSDKKKPPLMYNYDRTWTTRRAIFLALSASRMALWLLSQQLKSSISHLIILDGHVRWPNEVESCSSGRTKFTQDKHTLPSHYCPCSHPISFKSRFNPSRIAVQWKIIIHNHELHSIILHSFTSDHSCSMMTQINPHKINGNNLQASWDSTTMVMKIFGEIMPPPFSTIPFNLWYLRYTNILPKGMQGYHNWIQEVYIGNASIEQLGGSSNQMQTF